MVRSLRSAAPAEEPKEPPDDKDSKSNHRKDPPEDKDKVRSLRSAAPTEEPKDPPDEKDAKSIARKDPLEDKDKVRSLRSTAPAEEPKDPPDEKDAKSSKDKVRSLRSAAPAEEPKESPDDKDAGKDPLDDKVAKSNTKKDPTEDTKASARGRGSGRGSLRSAVTAEEPKDPPASPEKEAKTTVEKLKASEGRGSGRGSLRSAAPVEEPVDSDDQEAKTGGRRKDGGLGGSGKEKEKKEPDDEKEEKEEEEEGSSSKKAAYGCQLAPRLPPGQKVRDARGDCWVLGRPVGSGGFGDIYLCDRGQGGECGEEARFVMKVEPHSNGPLFTEMHCLLRIGLPRHREGLQEPVPLPLLHASGSTEFEGIKLRFLVIDRLGSDLDKWFQGGTSPIPLPTVLRVATMVLQALRFVHTLGYTHNDVKAQNLLVGLEKESRETVHLVDFGLACRYRDTFGFHGAEEPDERKAHDGTLEYTSRDAHTGAHSRRGDLETLGYNMVHWAAGTLPWLTELEDPEKVESSKKAYMDNIIGFLSKCFGSVYPPVLEQFLEYVKDLDFQSDPDYEAIADMFTTSLLAMGKSQDSKLIWTKPKKKGRGKKKEDLLSRIEELTMDENSSGGAGSAENSRRSSRRLAAEEVNDDDEGTTSSWNWESVLSQNPDRLVAKPSKAPVEKSLREEAWDKRQKEALQHPTPAMRRIMDKVKNLKRDKEEMSLKDQLSEFNKQRAAELKSRFQDELVPCYNTPAMEDIIQRRAIRLAGGVPSPTTPPPSPSPPPTPPSLSPQLPSLKPASPSSKPPEESIQVDQSVPADADINSSVEPVLTSEENMEVDENVPTDVNSSEETLLPTEENRVVGQSVPVEINTLAEPLTLPMGENTADSQNVPVDITSSAEPLKLPVEEGIRVDQHVPAALKSSAEPLMAPTEENMVVDQKLASDIKSAEEASSLPMEKNMPVESSVAANVKSSSESIMLPTELATEFEKINNKETVSAKDLTEEDKSILDDFLDLEPELDKTIATTMASSPQAIPISTQPRLNPFDQLLLSPMVQRPSPAHMPEFPKIVAKKSAPSLGPRPPTSIPPPSVQATLDSAPRSPWLSERSASPLKPLLGFNSPLKPMFDDLGSPKPPPVFQTGFGSPHPYNSPKPTLESPFNSPKPVIEPTGFDSSDSEEDDMMSKTMGNILSALSPKAEEESATSLPPLPSLSGAPTSFSSIFDIPAGPSSAPPPKLPKIPTKKVKDTWLLTPESRSIAKPSGTPNECMVNQFATKSLPFATKSRPSYTSTTPPFEQFAVKSPGLSVTKAEAAKEGQMKAEQEAALKAGNEARMKVEREAALKAEREAALKAEREAALKAEKEATRKLEQEAAERAAEVAAQRAALLEARKATQGLAVTSAEKQSIPVIRIKTVGSKTEKNSKTIVASDSTPRSTSIVKLKRPSNTPSIKDVAALTLKSSLFKTSSPIISKTSPSREFSFNALRTPPQVPALRLKFGNGAWSTGGKKVYKSFMSDNPATGTPKLIIRSAKAELKKKHRKDKKKNTITKLNIKIGTPPSQLVNPPRPKPSESLLKSPGVVKILTPAAINLLKENSPQTPSRRCDNENIIGRNLLETLSFLDSPKSPPRQEGPAPEKVSERLSDSSEDSEDIEILAVRPVTTNTNNLDMIQQNLLTHEKPKTSLPCHNKPVKEKVPEKLVVNLPLSVKKPASPPPIQSEMDLAISSILGDSSGSLNSASSINDLKAADQPLPLSCFEMESAVNSILGGEEDSAIQNLNLTDIESVVQKQPTLVARLNSEFSTGTEKGQEEEKNAPKTPFLTVRKPCEINVSPPKSPDKQFSHSIINLLSPTGSNTDMPKSPRTNSAHHPFRPDVSDEEDEDESALALSVASSRAKEKKHSEKPKAVLSSDLQISDESSSDEENDARKTTTVDTTNDQEEQRKKLLEMLQQRIESEKQRKLLFLKKQEEEEEETKRQQAVKESDEKAAAAAKREKLIAEMEKKRELEQQRQDLIAMRKQEADEKLKADREKTELEKAKMLREIEEQKKAMEEAEKQAARIRAEIKEKQRKIEEAEKERKAEEAESKRKAEESEIERVAAEQLAAEAKAKQLAEDEAEVARIAAEESEAERIAAEESAIARKQAEAEAARIAVSEAEAAMKLAEAARKEVEVEAARMVAEKAELEKKQAEATRKHAEAEAAMIAAEEAEVARVAAEEAVAARVAAEEAEKSRKKAEAEAARIAAEEVEAAKKAAEEAEEARLKAETVAARIAAEEAETARKHYEAESARIAAEEAEAARKEAARIAAEEAEEARKHAEAEAARIASEEAEKARREAEAEAAMIAAEEAVAAKKNAEAEAARIAAEEAEVAKVAADEAETARKEAEAEAARIAAEETEAARKHVEAEAAKIAAEEAEVARIAAEEAEAEAARIAVEEAEAEAARIVAEEAEVARKHAEAETARIASEEAEAARVAAEEAEAARVEAEEAVVARLAAEEAEAARKAAEEAEAVRLVAEELEAARKHAEGEAARIAAEKAEAVRKHAEAEAASIAAEEAEIARKHAEAEVARLAAEEAEAARLAARETEAARKDVEAEAALRLAKEEAEPKHKSDEAKTKESTLKTETIGKVGRPKTKTKTKSKQGDEPETRNAVFKIIFYLDEQCEEITDCANVSTYFKEDEDESEELQMSVEDAVSPLPTEVVDLTPTRSTRGKKINYLEMHTGKLSPQNMFRPGEGPSEKKTKASPIKAKNILSKRKTRGSVTIEEQSTGNEEVTETDAVHPRFIGKKVPFEAECLDDHSVIQKVEEQKANEQATEYDDQPELPEKQTKKKGKAKKVAKNLPASKDQESRTSEIKVEQVLPVVEEEVIETKIKEVEKEETEENEPAENNDEQDDNIIQNKKGKTSKSLSVKRLGTNKIFSARRKRDCRTEAGDPLRKVVKKKILKAKPKVVLKENPADVSIEIPPVSEVKNAKGEEKFDSLPEALIKPTKTHEKVKPKTISALHKKKPKVKALKTINSNKQPLPNEPEEKQKEDILQTEELQDDTKLGSEPKQKKGKTDETNVGNKKNKTLNVNKIKHTNQTALNKKVIKKKEDVKKVKAKLMTEVSAETVIEPADGKNITKKIKNKPDASKETEKISSVKLTEKARKSSVDHETSSEPSIKKKGKSNLASVERNADPIEKDNLKDQESKKGENKSGPIKKKAKNIIKAQKVLVDQKASPLPSSKKGKTKELKTSNEIINTTEEETSSKSNNKPKKAKPVPNDETGTLTSKDKEIPEAEEDAIEIKEKGKGKVKIKKDPLPELSSELKPITDIKQAPKRKQEALTEKLPTQKKIDNKKAKTVVSKKRTRANAPSTRSINTKGVEHSPINKVPIKKKQPVKTATEETLESLKPQTEEDDKTMEPTAKGVKRITNRTSSKDTEIEAKRVKVDDEVSFISPKVVKQKAPAKKTKDAPVESGSPVMKLIQGVGRRLGLLKK